eukprot:PRCOL_00000243-RA
MATSGGDDKAFEVVCTGAALRLAKGWLGGAEGEDEDDVVDDSAHIEARQARLGLGAKYLPHNAAVQDPLRRVLGKHAKKTRERRAAEEAEAAGQQGESDSEDEAHESRAAALARGGRTRKGKHPRRAAADDLLAAVPTAASKKRNKKKRRMQQQLHPQASQ